MHATKKLLAQVKWQFSSETRVLHSMGIIYFNIFNASLVNSMAFTSSLSIQVMLLPSFYFVVIMPIKQTMNTDHCRW